MIPKSLPIRRRDALIGLAGLTGLSWNRRGHAGEATQELKSFVHPLLAGTRWETGCHVRSSGRPGPIVLIMGGVHGDEPAGALAADSIRTWSFHRGSMLVIPRTNQPSLAAGTRFTPDSPHPDLARCFPQQLGQPPQGPLASALWGLIVRLEPDWILDLHEGWGVHRRNPETLGSTVMHDAATRIQAERMVEAVNGTIRDRKNHFLPFDGFLPGSSVYAASRWLGIRCLVQETTRVGRSLALRVRHHEVMARRLLRDIGMMKEGS